MLNSTQADDPGLADAMDWLEERLQHFLAEAQPVHAAPVCPPPLPTTLRILSEQLGLSAFEQQVLLLCAGVTLAPDLAHLCAQAQGDPQAHYPTFALALSLFAEADWAALSPASPLRYWHLLEVDYTANRPLTISALRADERIVNYLTGLNQLDHRLRPFLLPLPPEAQPLALPPSQQNLVNQALAHLAHPETTSRPPILQLVGPDALSKRLVARQIAARLGLQLYSLPAQALPAEGQKLEDLARLWQRESTLLPLALYLDVAEEEPATAHSDLWRRVQQFFYRSNGLFMLDTREAWSDIAQATYALDVQKPTPAEQIAAWQAALSPLAAGNGPVDTLDLPARLTAQFNLNLPTIHHIAGGSKTTATPADRPVDQPLSERMWQACLTYTRPRLDKLAQRITPQATWADIVLPPEQLRLLRHIAAQIPQRSQVYESWGFRRRSSRGLGITVLFAGDSGTGKTMAAEILANHLHLNLYRIDLSSVVSKYIGETEKNLRRLFDAAEDGGALLFFDEADALFGKRSEVKDSHDRYANIEINYLLQRLEAYQGLAILATNMKGGLDEAFTRRLRFSITFQKPDETYRMQIWQNIFPPETPVNGLDYAYLARTFKLAGGSIYNIALNAAFMAATAATPVTMAHVLEAVRIEMLKEDRLLNEPDFSWNGAPA